MENPNLGSGEEREALNNRQEQMIIYLNQETGSDHPITVESYNALGRSEGILNLLSTDEASRKKLQDKFLAISRTKK